MVLLAALLTGIGTGMFLAAIVAGYFDWNDRKNPFAPREGFLYIFAEQSIINCVIGALTGLVVYWLGWPSQAACPLTPVSIGAFYGMWSAVSRLYRAML